MNTDKLAQVALYACLVVLVRVTGPEQYPVGSAYCCHLQVTHTTADTLFQLLTTIPVCNKSLGLQWAWQQPITVGTKQWHNTQYSC